MRPLESLRPKNALAMGRVQTTYVYNKYARHGWFGYVKVWHSMQNYLWGPANKITCMFLCGGAHWFSGYVHHTSLFTGWRSHLLTSTRLGNISYQTSGEVALPAHLGPLHSKSKCHTRFTQVPPTVV